MPERRVICVVISLLTFPAMPASPALARSVADRYEMRVALEPAQARFAV